MARPESVIFSIVSLQVWHLFINYRLKTPQFKAVCKDDSGYTITQLKQQKSKRWYYLAAHRHIVNVLTSNITFLNFPVMAAVGVSQTLRRWTEGATYIRQGGHHILVSTTFTKVKIQHTYIHTYIHTNLYSAKIVERIWGASTSGRPILDLSVHTLYPKKERHQTHGGRPKSVES